MMVHMTVTLFYIHVMAPLTLPCAIYHVTLFIRYPIPRIPFIVPTMPIIKGKGYHGNILFTRIHRYLRAQNTRCRAGKQGWWRL
jgi:hypothetical protein